MYAALVSHECDGSIRYVQSDIPAESIRRSQRRFLDSHSSQIGDALLEDFSRANLSPRNLSESVPLPGGCAYILRAEYDALVSPPGSAGRDAGGPALVVYSRVGFSADNSVALVRRHAGNRVSCIGEYLVLGKAGAEWVVQERIQYAAC